MSFIIDAQDSTDEIVLKWETYLSKFKKSADILHRAIRAIPHIIELLKASKIEQGTAILLFDAVGIKIKRAPKLTALWNAVYARLCYELKIESPLLDLVLSHISPVHAPVDKSISSAYRLESSVVKLWTQFTLNIFNTYSDDHDALDRAKKWIAPCFENIEKLIVDIQPNPLFFMFYMQPTISEQTQLKAAYNSPVILKMCANGFSNLGPLFLDVKPILKWAKSYANDSERIDILLKALEYKNDFSTRNSLYMGISKNPLLCVEDIYGCIEDTELLRKLKLCIDLGMTSYKQIKECIYAPNSFDTKLSLPVFDMTS